MKDLGLSLAPAAKFPGAGDEGVAITEVDPSSDAADKGLETRRRHPSGRRRDRVRSRRCRRRREEGHGQR